MWNNGFKMLNVWNFQVHYQASREKAILLHIQANIVVHRRYLYTPRITLDDEKIACTQVYRDQKKIVEFWLQDASALFMKLCCMFRGFEQQEDLAKIWFTVMEIWSSLFLQLGTLSFAKALLLQQPQSFWFPPHFQP